MINEIKPMSPETALLLQGCRETLGPGLWLDVLPGTAVWNILGLIAPSNRVWRDWVKSGALRINGIRFTLNDTKQELAEGLFIVAKGRERWILSVQHA